MIFKMYRFYNNKNKIAIRKNSNDEEIKSSETILNYFSHAVSVLLQAKQIIFNVYSIMYNIHSECVFMCPLSEHVYVCALDINRMDTSLHNIYTPSRSSEKYLFSQIKGKRDKKRYWKRIKYNENKQTR